MVYYVTAILNLTGDEKTDELPAHCTSGACLGECVKQWTVCQAVMRLTVSKLISITVYIFTEGILHIGNHTNSHQQQKKEAGE